MIESGGEGAYLGVQLAVGDRAAVARLALPVERHPVAALGEVPVEAVRADVEHSAREPAAATRPGDVSALRRAIPAQAAGGGAPGLDRFARVSHAR